MKIFKSLFFLLKNQSGAMFGMDARVALIIASVLAATGGVTMMSQLERSRVQGAERSLEIIKSALASYYKNNKTGLPRDLQTLFDEGYIEESSILSDPWGSPWEYHTTQKEIRLEDIPIKMYMATIHSAGKDALLDSVIITTPASWSTWEPMGDDIGSKFSTIEIDKLRVTEYRNRGKMIIDKLQNYEAAGYLSAENGCRAGGTDVWCNADGFTRYNFYPVSSLDNSGAYYWEIASNGGSSVSYVSGDYDDMKNLMKTLGLPISFAKDPWGRILCYHSNITGTNVPPFTASVWYAEDGNC